MATFADMLVYLRKRDNLSQQTLAEKTKLTRSAISMYETGKREPDFETLEVLADFFNVNMDTLLGKSVRSFHEIKKAPDTLINVEGLSVAKRAFIMRILSLSDEEVQGLDAIADQVLALRGK